MITEILVYFFSFGAFISGFLVISSTNPVHSVFSLVMCFVNSSILLLMLGFEFLALLFIIVYVGALAILFLFVVMMLNIRLVELIENSTRYIPIGIIIGIVFLIELLVVVDSQYSLSPSNTISQLWFLNNLYIIDSSAYILTNSTVIGSETLIGHLKNIEAIGHVLYTEGYLYFWISSLVLLVAMVGAIVMTMYHEQSVRRQDIFSQITTDIKLRPLSLNTSTSKIKPEFRLRN